MVREVREVRERAADKVVSDAVVAAAAKVAVVVTCRNMTPIGDGAISREEAPEYMSNFFDRVDTNGDGKIGR